MGTILANFRLSGNIPVVKTSFVSIVNGLLIVNAISFNNFVEIVSYPLLFLVGRLFIILGLWLRLECSLDSLSIDSAHVIYVSEGYDVAYNRRTASQPSHVVLRVTWYVKTFRNINYVC